MRAVTVSALTTAALALSPAAHASTLQDFAASADSLTRVVAALGTLALLFVLKTRPQRVVKMDVHGRQYDPNVRGLFDK